MNQKVINFSALEQMFTCLKLLGNRVTAQLVAKIWIVVMQMRTLCQRWDKSIIAKHSQGPGGASCSWLWDLHRS